jgi:hypothetical protein
MKIRNFIIPFITTAFLLVASSVEAKSVPLITVNNLTQLNLYIGSDNCDDQYHCPTFSGTVVRPGSNPVEIIPDGDFNHLREAVEININTGEIKDDAPRGDFGYGQCTAKAGQTLILEMIDAKTISCRVN